MVKILIRWFGIFSLITISWSQRVDNIDTELGLTPDTVELFKFCSDYNFIGVVCTPDEVNNNQLAPNTNLAKVHTLNVEQLKITNEFIKLFSNIKNLYIGLHFYASNGRSSDFTEPNNTEIESLEFLKSLKKLEILYITGVNLKDIDFPNLRNPHLFDVILNSCNITSIQKSTFAETFQLLYIDLFDNQLVDIEGVFDHLTSVLEIILTNNKIARITNETFQDCSDLESLDVSYNEINTIEKFAFHNSPRLESLNLNGNHLMELNLVLQVSYKQVIFQLDENDLQLIDLDTTTGLEFDLTLKNLFAKNLKQINLPDGSELQISISGKENLSANDLESFVVQNNNLTSLELVDQRNLTGLSFKHMQSDTLETLAFSYCHLKSVSFDGIAESFPNLGKIKLVHNNVTSDEVQNIYDAYQGKIIIDWKEGLDDASSDWFIEENVGYLDDDFYV